MLLYSAILIILLDTVACQLDTIGIHYTTIDGNTIAYNLSNRSAWEVPVTTVNITLTCYYGNFSDLPAGIDTNTRDTFYYDATAPNILVILMALPSGTDTTNINLLGLPDFSQYTVCSNADNTDSISINLAVIGIGIYWFNRTDPTTVFVDRYQLPVNDGLELSSDILTYGRIECVSTYANITINDMYIIAPNGSRLTLCNVDFSTNCVAVYNPRRPTVVQLRVYQITFSLAEEGEYICSAYDELGVLHNISFLIYLNGTDPCTLDFTCGENSTCSSNNTAGTVYSGSVCVCDNPTKVKNNSNCECPWGSHLSHNDTCQDIDECTANTNTCAQPNTLCINRDRGYDCVCSYGYTRNSTNYCNACNCSIYGDNYTCSFNTDNQYYCVLPTTTTTTTTITTITTIYTTTSPPHPHPSTATPTIPTIPTTNTITTTTTAIEPVSTNPHTTIASVLTNITLIVAIAREIISSFLSSNFADIINLITETSVENILETGEILNNNIDPLTMLSFGINPDRILIIKAFNILSENSSLIFGNTSNNQSFTKEKDSVFFQIIPYIPNTQLDAIASFPARTDNTSYLESIAIPQSIFSSLLNNITTRILVSIFILKVNTTEGSSRENNNQVATNIFSISIQGITPGMILAEPVKLTFPTTHFIANPICSFLYFNTSNNSKPPIWSQEGVRLADRSPERIICESDHLTSFAVLAGSTTPYSGSERLVLEIISYTLLGISLVFLFCSLAAFFYSAKVVFKVEANILYFNYGLALTLATLTFIIGAELHRLSSHYYCIFFSFLTHYTWLVVFASSTALSALIFYTILLSGMQSNRRYIAPYLIPAAWSIPLLITIAVAIPVLTNEDTYLVPDSCILSPKKLYTIPFYGLIFILLLINSIILVATLVKIYKAMKKKLSPNPTYLSILLIYRKMAISALILLPILGVPWIIVPIIAYSPRVYFLSSILDWIFIILNSPGGIAFFIVIIRIEGIKLPFRKVPKTHGYTKTKTISLSLHRFKPVKPANSSEMSNTIVNPNAV